MELALKLYDYGCPCYVSNDGSKTRNGAICCYYCGEVIEHDLNNHLDNCPWLEIKQIAKVLTDGRTPTIQ